MKALFGLLLISSFSYAQDASTYLKNFDAKVYSLKTKGVKDFTVDIESSKLTKQLNDQQIFGKIEEVYFRTYWTSQPERLAIEVMGLPDGFKEVREELKANIVPLLENILPPSFAQRFSGYKFSKGTSGNEYIAQDTTGIAPIPSYTIKFNREDMLETIIGNMAIGSLIMKPVYAKESFADGKLVLKEQTTTTQDNGNTVTIKKDLEYGKVDGIGVVTEVTVSTEQKGPATQGKSVSTSDTVEFKNYKINRGDALKYFLGNESLQNAGKKKK